MNLISRSFSASTQAHARRLALCTLLCFLPSLASASGITLVQHKGKDAGTNTTASLNFPNPNTAGNLIAVAIRGGLSSSQVFTVKDSNGNTYKQATQIGFTASAVTAAIYYAENIKGGANAVTVSMTVNAPLRFAILEYSGVATSNSLDATAAATQTGTAPNSGNTTTAVNGDLLLGSVSTVNSATFTAGAGYVIRDSVPNGSGTKLITEDQIQTVAGIASASATLATSDGWGALLAAFKPAGGVAVPSITSLSPTSGPAGTSVTITGTNFGASQGISTVAFNGTSASPTSWSNTSIVVPVPTGATTGNVVVTVGGLASNGVAFTVIVPPSITSLSPTSGPVGTSVTITGTNFGATQGTSTVSFNGTAATPTSWSTASIVVPVPNGATSGNVVVTVSGLASNGVAFSVLVPPNITSLNPTSGPVGTSVTITGTNFGATQGTSIVSFNGTATTPTNWSATSIVVPVPNGATTGNVVVTVGGLASNGMAFTVLVPPNITSLNPTSGPVGTSVTVSGTNFGATQGSSTITFNGSAATPTSWSASSLVVPVPSGATSGNIVVTVSGLASNGVAFTVLVPPNITSLSPTSGPVSTSVTVTGTNFGSTQGSSTVSFNGTAATPTSWSATSIVVPVPSGATTGNVVVTVSGLASNGVAFTVLPTPSISSLSPTSGPLGTSVTVTGTNFGASQGSSTVTFNGVNAGSSSWSNTSITTQVPAGATTGNVVVTVGGVPSNGASFTVTPPVINFLSPTSGGFATPVTIGGAGFGFIQGSSTVSFGGTLATPTSWNMTSITVPVPTGASSGNVVVTVGGLSSNGVNFTVLPISVSVSPSSATVITNQSVGYSATVQGDTANLGVNWSLTGAGCSGSACGTLGPATSNHTTSYTAPPTVPNPPTVTITATSVADPTKSATSTVTIVPPAPNITGLSPASGPVNTLVTISGTNFGASQGASQVTFNGAAATPTSWSDTGIAVPVPSGATTGNVVVTVGGQASNGVSFTVLVPPSISGLSPTSGPVGTSVTVTGTNFGATQGSSTITFNGTAATPASWSATSIVVPLPSGATTGNVVVTVSGLASNGVSFTVLFPPSISSLSPNAGSVGTFVTINGANFGASQGTSQVTFNGTAATPASWSATGIVVPVPTGATTGNVVVTVNGLSSSGAPFTVNSISVSVSPATVTLGTGAQQLFSATVQNDSQGNGVTWSLSGAGCSGAACGTIQPYNVAPGEVYTTPATAPNPSTVTLTATSVTDPTKSGTATITVVQATAPNITSVSPSSGPLGSSVTITGTNFGNTQGSSVVSFNSIQVVPTNWSNTSIVATVPTSLQGNANALVQVVVLGLASNQVNFSITPPPTMSSLNPSTGPVGSTVTIAGANFGATQGTTTVTFNGTPASPTSWSNTSIVVPVPNGATSGNVLVTLAGVASNGLVFTIGPDVTPPTSPSNLVASTSTGLDLALSFTASTDNVGVTNYLIEQCQGAGCTNFTQNQPIPGNIIPFVSVGPLSPATSYSFRMRARDAAGNVSGYSNVSSATTNPLGINFLNPNSGAVGTVVTISGAGFGASQGSSSVTFNGTPATPTNWSDTSITAPVPAGASSGYVVVTTTVGTSNGAFFTIGPNISSLNPTSGPVGSNVTITGTGFGASQGNSTVTFNGTSAFTASWSDTSITVVVPNGALSGNVVVTTASGASNAVPFTVTPPTPNIVSVSPASGPVGTSVFVVGSNFGAVQGTSTVTFNGTVAVPSSWIDSRVIVSVPSGATSGNVVVTTGGGASNGVPFTVTPGPPSITNMSPSSAIVGGGGLTITVTGTNFVSSSAVQWNGSPLSTTFLSSTQLQATVTSSNIARIGAAKVTVSNASVGTGVSNASTFFVGTTGGGNFATIVVNQTAKDIVYDPANQVFYLSVPGTASTNPNTIAVLDPTTATITSTQPAGNNPNVLAISGDSQFLYAGIDGSSIVQRFTLPGLAPDMFYSLGSNFFGPLFALDLQVAPQNPHTTAVALGGAGTPIAQGGIMVFDDTTPRPTNAPDTPPLFDSIQWGSDTSTLFASNTESTGYDFYTLAVNSSGVTLNQDFPGTFTRTGGNIHFDPVANLVYSDDGHAINPSTGVPIGNFNAPGVMAADPALNVAFFASMNLNSIATVQSFDLTHFTPIGTVALPNVTATPLHLIRWGQNGLAFIGRNFDGTSQVILMGGDFVAAAPPFVVTPPPAPSQPPVPAPNAPTIASLNPSSAVWPNVRFVLNVAGTQFDPAATVLFNGRALSTTYVSSTQLQAVVPGSSVGTPGTASVVVANPPASGGNSGSASFFVGSNGGTSSAGTGFAFQAINQTSNQIAFDPASQRLYLSVPNSVATGNTIAVLDPATAAIVGQQYAGSNPNALTISDDGQFLYAGIDGSSSVQRFVLPGLALDIAYPLGADPFFGPYFAQDLGVAPGAPHTTAVTFGNFNISPTADGGMVIFDDATPRPTEVPAGHQTFTSLQWGSDATALFAANDAGSGFDFYSFSVTTSGVSLTSDFRSTFSSFHNAIHFDRGTNLIYSDDGHAVVPATGASAGTFPVTGLTSPVMAPDSSLSLAFFAAKTGSSVISIYSFNLSTFAAVSSINISNVNGNPIRLVRWGQNGLAFNTDAGQVVLIGGNFVH